MSKQIEGELILKWKKCSKCGNIQPEQKSRIFKCKECGYTCVDGSNVWLLADKYSNRRDVEKLKRKYGYFEANDLSSTVSHLKEAIERWEED